MIRPTIFLWQLLACVVSMIPLATPEMHAQEIAHWSLDSNTNEIVGGRHGTLLGDATYSNNVPAALLGYSTHSLSLDGALDKMVYDVQGGDATTSNYTVALWFNPVAPSLNPDGWMELFGTRFPNQFGFDAQINGNLNKLRIDVGNGSDFNSRVLDATYSVKLNEWHHAAFVVTPTTARVFLDGSLLGTHTYPSTTPVLFDSSHDIAIGAFAALANPDSTDFHGLIDDVRIFGGALTQQEVQQAMAPDPTLSIWNVTGGGNWTDATKWLLGDVPNDSADRALFSNSISSPSTVTVNADITVNRIIFDSAARSYTIAGDGVHALTLAGSQPLAIDSGIVVLAGTHTIAAPISSGYLSKNGPGTLVLTGTSNVEIDLNEGLLAISGGGAVSSGNVSLSQHVNTQSSAMTVDGAGSTLNISSLLSVGSSGSGSLAVTNGGDVTLNAASAATIGTNVGATGAVTISGPSSTWNGSALYVGYEGSGELTIQDGGTMSITQSAVGFSPGGAGIVTVEGSGSTWTMTGRLGIGGDAVNNVNGGTGLVTVASGGTVSVGLSTTVFPDGQLRLEGGAFAAAALDNRGILDVGGTLNATGGVTMTASGVLRGGGQIVGDVNNGGRVAPGNSPGIINIDGDYSQQPGGVLEIEVGGLTPGTQHDKLVVTGTAALAGRLEVPIIDGFTPSANDPPITILEASSGVSGQFNSVFSPNLNAIAPGLALDVIYPAVGATDVRLRFVAPSTEIQFQATDVAAIWSVGATWTTSTVPDETNDIIVQNLAGVPQQVSIVAADAFLHKLTVSSDASPITVEVTSGRSLVATAGVSIEGGGGLAGDGTVVGNVAVGVAAGSGSAVLSPGTATAGMEVGSLNVEGNYTQGASGVFSVGIKSAPAAGQFDVLDVTGQVQLGGTLLVDASQLGAVTVGAPYVLIRASEGSGEFDGVEVIGAAGNTDEVYFSPFYGSPPAAAGNAMAAAATGDYLSGGRWLGMGDADGDLDVDGDDARVFAGVLIKGDLIDFVLGEGHVAAENFKDAFNFFTDGEPIDVISGRQVKRRTIDFDDIQGFTKKLSASQGIGIQAAYGVFEAAYQQALAERVPEPSAVAMMAIAVSYLALTRKLAVNSL